MKIGDRVYYKGFSCYGTIHYAAVDSVMVVFDEMVQGGHDGGNGALMRDLPKLPEYNGRCYWLNERDLSKSLSPTSQLVAKKFRKIKSETMTTFMTQLKWKGGFPSFENEPYRELVDDGNKIRNFADIGYHKVMYNNFYIVGEKKTIRINGKPTTIYPVVTFRRGGSGYNHIYIIKDTDFDMFLKFQTLHVGDIIKKGGTYLKVTSLTHDRYLGINAESLFTGTKLEIRVLRLPKMKTYKESAVAAKVEKVKAVAAENMKNLEDEIRKNREANLMKPRRVLGFQSCYVSTV